MSLTGQSVTIVGAGRGRQVERGEAVVQVRGGGAGLVDGEQDLGAGVRAVDGAHAVDAGFAGAQAKYAAVDGHAGGRQRVGEGPLWTLILLAVVALVTLEWATYHRRVTV